MFGLNGNHLNWDTVTLFDERCLDCESAIEEVLQYLKNRLNSGEITEEEYEEEAEKIREEIYEQCYEGNHTHQYTFKHGDWLGVIEHDTNNNFIWVSGILPVHAFNEDGWKYLIKYHEDDFEYLPVGGEGFLRFKRVL